MMPADEICPNNFQNIEKTLIVKHAVNILPVIFIELFCSKLLDLFDFFLEFLQPQSHAANSSFVGTFRD